MSTTNNCCKNLDIEENILLQNIQLLRETNVDSVIIYRQYDVNSTNWTIELRQLDAFALMHNRENKNSPSISVKKFAERSAIFI